MNTKEAINLCEEYGWEVTTISKGFLLEAEDDRVTFNTAKELIEYAKELKKSR